MEGMIGGTLSFPNDQTSSIFFESWLTEHGGLGLHINSTGSYSDSFFSNASNLHLTDSSIDDHFEALLSSSSSQSSDTEFTPISSPSQDDTEETYWTTLAEAVLQEPHPTPYTVVPLLAEGPPLTQTSQSSNSAPGNVEDVPEPVQQQCLPPNALYSGSEFYHFLMSRMMGLSGAPRIDNQCSPNGWANRNIYLAWSTPPPERIHATSPSRLSTSKRKGETFSFSIQLVMFDRVTGTTFPCISKEDIPVRICVFGKKRKPQTKQGGKKKKKTAASRKIRLESLVLLESNPIGSPLLIQDAPLAPMEDRVPHVQSILRKGECAMTFENVYFTCGSNAARSTNALPNAKCWDWDYYLAVLPMPTSSDHSDSDIPPLLSCKIMTDSNRSLTREKRKISDCNSTEPGQEDLKRQRVAQMPSPVVSPGVLLDGHRPVLMPWNTYSSSNSISSQNAVPLPQSISQSLSSSVMAQIY